MLRTQHRWLQTWKDKFTLAGDSDAALTIALLEETGSAETQPMASGQIYSQVPATLAIVLVV